VQAASTGLGVAEMARGQYWIHPALSEVVENALLKLDLTGGVQRLARPGRGARGRGQQHREMAPRSRDGFPGKLEKGTFLRDGGQDPPERETAEHNAGHMGQRGGRRRRSRSANDLLK
jgi:hypothetical protein